MKRYMSDFDVDAAAVAPPPPVAPGAIPSAPPAE
jgi:hypothetical protein